LAPCLKLFFFFNCNSHHTKCLSAFVAYKPLQSRTIGSMTHYGMIRAEKTQAVPSTILHFVAVPSFLSAMSRYIGTKHDGVRLLWNRSQSPFTNQVAGISIALTMKGVWIMLSNVAGATGIVVSVPTSRHMNQSAESRQ